MDHEYSISGCICVAGATSLLEGASQRLYRFKDYCFVLASGSGCAETDSLLTVAPQDRRVAGNISESDVLELCQNLSVEFQAKVRLCKLHEEYGLLNVFNGGSDYEVVASDRFTCEFEKGTLILQEKVSD